MRIVGRTRIILRLCLALGLSTAAGAASSQAALAAADARGPVAGSVAPAATNGDVFNYGRFGSVTVYRGAGEIREVVLFLSGDGGWNLGVISMARRLTAQGALVVGVDIRHYLAELEKAAQQCVSPAVDLENLSHYVQAKLGLKHYVQPTLVGYSSGATLVYATLAEAPDGLFKGALSLGFCPDLDLKKPVCKGSGIESTPRSDAKGLRTGVDFLPAKKLSGHWISLQGETDQVCPAPLTRQFIAQVPDAEVVMLPKVGHGYSVEKNWVPQFDAAFARVTETRPEARSEPLPEPVADLPLTVVPASGDGHPGWFGIFLSGDGGWVCLDKGVSGELARHGIPFIGWDSLKYFWEARTPDGAAADLDRVIQHFARQWGRSRALLVGYSQGADTLPFMINRLPESSRQLVGMTALLGISNNAVFEFHLADWLGDPAGGLPTGPELARWRGSPYVCLYGEDDADSACKQLTGRDGSAVEMPDGHHFGGSYVQIADVILSRLPKP